MTSSYIKALPRYSVMIVSLAVLLTVWWLFSLRLPERLLPGPIAVFSTAWNITASGEFLTQAVKTVSRVLLGFCCASVLSSVLGIAMGMNKYIEAYAEPYVLAGLTIPAICWAAISIIWFRLTEFAAVFTITVLVAPMMTVGVVQAMRAMEKDFADMAKAFRVSKPRQVLHLFLPQLLPHFLGSARYGLALSWKVVVIIEMMGLTSGIGYKISFWYGLFSMKHVLAWTLSFTVCMFIIEVFVFKVAERKLLRWRVDPGV